MEAAASLFFCLIILALFVIGLGYAYKKRAAIQKWLNTPYYASDDRRLRLKRKIEDAERELQALEKEEAETGE